MDYEKVHEISNGEFGPFVSNGIVLIDFFAEWCMPCVMMGPVMEELSRKFKGKIKFGKVNVDENADIAQKFSISSIPNFILFKDGEILDRFVGAIPADDLEERLKGHLK